MERQQQAQVAYATSYDEGAEYSMSLLDDDQTRVALLCSGFLVAATASVVVSRESVRRADQRW
jgi:hypothetical protein